MSLSQLQAVLDGSPFARYYGFRVETADEGTAAVLCPANTDFLRPDGIIAGPVFMAAADVAMWMAVINAYGREGNSTVTVEMKTNFVSALTGAQEFRCTARILKSGSRLVFGTADCSALDGRLLTHHTMTYIRRAGKSNADVP